MSKISLGTDHGGYALKEVIKKWLLNNNYEVLDFGTHSEDSVDYPDYIYPATKSVANNESDLGIVFCGTGLGASYVANKVHGIRAALCQDEFSARLSRQHNNANVLVMGGRVVTEDRAIFIVQEWLNSEFMGDRHQQRIDKIHRIEQDECQNLQNKS